VTSDPVQYPLIGLLGKARSGKDTFARGLVERGYTRVAFADPLRELVEEINPIIGLDASHPDVGGTYRVQRLGDALAALGGWESLKDTPYGPEARRLLQQSGQAVRRLDEGFWLRAGMEKAHEAAYRGSGGAVITDVRYTNEADAIQEAGGVLVRIVRPGLESTDTHSSETELDRYPVDFTVRNSGTAEDFVEFARTVRF
jgi:hypothetical protein